jgi:Tol biopolymer transport system component
VAVGPEWKPSEPAISPDGSKLAFISGRSLYLWQGDRRLRLASGNASAPAFFPDGMRIAFASGPPGQRAIAAVATSGGDVIPLARHSGDCTEPAISPDGRMLAFACEETGAEHIWLQELLSGRLRRVTDGSCSNRTPAWSVDSRRIIFASDCRRGLGLSALYQLVVDEHR